MRTVGRKLIGLVTTLLVAGSAYASSDTDKELAEMRALVKELGQKVDAQQEQLEHQGGLLQDAQQVVREQQREDQEKGALSGVGEFWQAIDVNMSVAGSYAYNFHNPHPSDGSSGEGLNAGNSGFFYPFHPDHNSFQVDQVWFDIGKETTAESRAGFHATVLYGTTAGFLGQGGNPGFATFAVDTDGDGIPDDTITGIRRRDFNDSTSDYYVHQAFVQYLAPVGEGVEFTFGKFATPIGAEVADASKNWAVTRGNLYNLMQPIDHLGLMASTDVGPVTIGAGIVNQINLLTSSPDVNSEKSYLGRIAFAPSDMFSLATTVAYGAESPAFTISGDHDKTGLLDVLANFNSDAFSAYVNADYGWVEGTSLAAWGVSIAGLVPLTDVLSASLRLEYLRDQHNNSGTANFFPILDTDDHSEIYGATGTLAYEIAENLTVKGEVRWDHVEETAADGTHEFITKTGGGSRNQTVGLAQVVYAF
jgi:hypothetical protein